MATETRYLYSDTDLENVMQNIKQQLLIHMAAKGVITPEVHEDWSMNTAVLLKKPSFFAKAWGKYGWNDEKDRLNIIIVRQETMTKKESEDKDG